MSKYIFVRTDRKLYKVFLNDILFVEALKDYVSIQLKDKRFITHRSLLVVEGQLRNEENFVRISRSVIVNLEHITSIEQDTIYTGNICNNLGEKYRNQFYTSIKIL